MEIPLFEADAPMRFERIVLYPYPDMKRIWTRVWLPAVEDQAPNVEITVMNPDLLLSLQLSVCKRIHLWRTLSLF